MFAIVRFVLSCVSSDLAKKVCKIQKDVKNIHLRHECTFQNSLLLRGYIPIDMSFVSNAIYRIQNPL